MATSLTKPFSPFSLFPFFPKFSPPFPHTFCQADQSVPFHLPPNPNPTLTLSLSPSHRPVHHIAPLLFEYYSCYPISHSDCHLSFPSVQFHHPVIPSTRHAINMSQCVTIIFVSYPSFFADSDSVSSSILVNFIFRFHK